MRESVPTARYSPVCNVLRQWKTSLILTYRVYRLYDIYLSCSYRSVLLSLYTACGCPACYYCYIMRSSRVSVRSFLPPRVSRPRNVGTYLFTATRKTILFIIIVILAENASFTCKQRRHLLASMPLTTPKPQNTDTNRIHATRA